MKRIKWIKLQVDAFQDMRIKRIRRLRKGSDYVLLLLELKLLAAFNDDEGKIYFTEDQELTDQDLAEHFGTTVSFMTKALQRFETDHFIERLEKGHILILSWNEDQGLSKEDKVREQTRQRVAKHRAKKKDEEQTTAQEKIPEDVLELIADEVPDKDIIKTMSSKDMNSAIAHYKMVFGNMKSSEMLDLKKLEKEYGSELVCHAIDVTAERKVRGVNYIIGILRSDVGWIGG